MAWRVRYGDNIGERARRLADNEVPDTVNDPDQNVPLQNGAIEFEYCTRLGGARLRRDPEGVAYFQMYRGRVYRYVENFWRLPNRNYVFVRSQRYGENLQQTNSDPDPDDMHIITADGLLNSVYIVYLSDNINTNNWNTISCSCERRTFRGGNCKHMLAVQMVRDRGQPLVRQVRNRRNNVVRSNYNLRNRRGQRRYNLRSSTRRRLISDVVEEFNKLRF